MIFLAAGLLALTGQTGRAEDHGIASVRSFYFGNSFTGNTMPGLQRLAAEEP
jgi:hypothetical protein